VNLKLVHAQRITTTETMVETDEVFADMLRIIPSQKV